MLLCVIFWDLGEKEEIVDENTEESENGLPQVEDLDDDG
jgi:hypothetical protein